MQENKEDKMKAEEREYKNHVGHELVIAEEIKSGKRMLICKNCKKILKMEKEE